MEMVIDFGYQMVEYDVVLVYGGGCFGFMGVVVDVVLEVGGQVYGVIIEELVNWGISYLDLISLEIVDDMNICKN